ATEFARALAQQGRPVETKVANDHRLASDAAAKLFASGRLRQAETAYRELVSKHGDVDSYGGLARTLISLEDRDGALVALREGAAARTRRGHTVRARRRRDPRWSRGPSAREDRQGSATACPHAYEARSRRSCARGEASLGACCCGPGADAARGELGRGAEERGDDHARRALGPRERGRSSRACRS